MNLLKIKIPPECDGMSVRTFVRKHLGLSSRVLVKQKYKPQGMMINSLSCKSIDILHAGDVFSMDIAESIADEEVKYSPSDIEIDIIYEDSNYIVINKPFHMPVHPSAGHENDSVLNGVANYYNKTNQKTAFKPLYRLDRDTSGILVAGKNRLAVSSAKLIKTYYAVCEGNLSGEGTINKPITLAPGSTIKREVGGSTNAITHYKVINSNGCHSFVRINLETGRTHQIRVHFSSIGHSLAGDDMYGGSLDIISRQALYLGKVSLECTVLGINKEFDIGIPEDIENAFSGLVKV